MQQLIRSLKIKNIFKIKIVQSQCQYLLGSSNLIEGSGRAIVMLPNGTKLCIDDALYSSYSSRNLLIFKNIRYNGYHIETNNKGSENFLYIISIVSGQKLILEKLPIFSFGLYLLEIYMFVSHTKHTQQKINGATSFTIDNI